MANGGSIKYNIGFNVDKSGLNELKSSLQEIKNMTAKDFMDINGGNDLTKAKNELEKIHQTLGKVDAAFESAFNSDLGTLNIAKFNQTLSSSGLTIQKIQADLARTGTAGQNAFRNMTSQILTTNMKLKESHTLIDSMATTMANTIKWGAASSVMNSFTGTVQRAYGYVKNLDGSLNDIRIVTGKSADEMDRFAEKANKAAKNLGQTTTNYTDAALIYYQQGLSDAEVQARAEVTLKAANVTGQSGAEVSEQLTAVWNGYKVTAAETELYIDKLAAVAATTASDLEELSTGMSKVASAANLMGVDVDQLNAQLATIVSVTRQAPESVGTALKTIYARMGDIEAGLDSETTLGDYTEKMAAMGVNVLDMNGQLRDMGDVMEEIGGKWTSMSREQQIYLSQVMAGTRQYNNLLSLFDNWDQYTKSLETSANAAGTLQEQQDVYMESTQAHLAQLKASWEDLYDSLLDTDTINGVSDALSGIVSLMANFVDSIGGGSNVLLALGSIGGKVFSKHLANGIATFITNLQSAKDNATQLRAELAILNQYESANLQDDRTQVLVAMKRKILDLDKNITAEERNIANEYIKQQNELFKQQDALEARKAAAMETYNKVATDPGDINNPKDAERMAEKLNERATDIEGDINSTKIEGFDDALNKLNETRKKYNELARQGTDSTKDLEQAEQKLEKAAEDHNKTIETQIKLAQEVAANDDFEEKNKKELIEALETLEKMRSADGSLNLKNAQVVKQIQKVEEARVKTYKNQAEGSRQAAEEMLGFADASLRGKEAVDQLQGSYKSWISQLDLRNKIQQGIQLASSFGQVASAISSIGNIPDIWGNQDLSTGEKLLQTVTSLGFALPMLANSLGAIGKTLGINTMFMNAYTAAQMANKMSTTTLTAATAAGATAEQAKKLAILATMGTETARINVEEIILALSEKKIGTEMAEILINEALEESNIKVGNSALFAGKGVKTFLTSLGPVTIAIMGITAAIAILVPLVGALYKAFKDNSPEGQLKLLEDRAKKSAEAFEEVKQEVNEVQNALDKISSSYTTLEQLTVGTEEWYKALTDVNAEILKLIEKYPDLELYKYISTDINGIMRLNEEGFKAISDYNQGIYAASQNVSINDQKAVNAQRQEVLFNKTSDLEYEVAMWKDEVTARAAAEFYQDPRIGETLFTEAGAKALFESVFQTQDSLIAEYEKLGYSSESAVEDFNSGVSQMYDYLKENEEIIKEVASLNKTNQMLDDSQLANVLSAINTNRDVNQTKDLMGDDFSYSQIVQDSRKDVEKAFGDWNDSINYKKNDNEWKYIQDFIKLQGKDLEYKAQQWGKMVFEDEEGKEYKFSKDEVYDALGELYAPQEFENQLANKIKENLKDTLSNINLDELNNEELLNLDNFQNQLKGAFKQDGESGDKIADALFQEVVGEFGTNTVELNNFLSKINSINLQDANKLREFNNAARELEEGKISIEEFADTMDELKAATDLDNMTSKFKEAAESMGLKEEDAGKMQEYARNLMELSESSDTLDENLKKDAESAADLAIEITRMNKGINSLADGFENWSDIIKNSSKESMEFSEAMYEIKQALSDVLDVEADLISSNFVEEHLDDIKKASEGNAEAIDELRAQMDEEIIQKVTLGQSEDFAANVKELENSFKTELDRINMEIPDIEVGAILQDEGFLEAANKLVQESNMTADEANAYFAGIGYEPVYSTEDIETPAQSPNASTTMTVTSLGFAEDPISIMGQEIGFLKMPQLTMETRSTPLDPVESEANMRLMSFSGDKTPPKIRGLRKKATGSQNNYSTKNAGGGKGGRGGSGKGGGGGGKGGGGGSKAKDPNKKDPITEKRDLYHDINYELEQINNELTKQERLTEKLTGKNRIEALNKELEILEKQADAEHRKLLLLQNERDTLKETLKGDGVLFDDEGDISNYNAALDAKLATLNEMINRYNAMSAEEQEKFESELETAQKAYEKFKEDMERYDELMASEIFEAQERIDDILDQQVEKNIEQLEVEIELNIDTKEAERQLREFVKDFVKQIEEDDFANNAIFSQQQLNSYLGTDGDLAVYEKAMRDAYEAYQKIQAGGTDDIYGNDAEKAKEAFENYRDEVYDIYGEMGDLIDEVYEAQLDGIDEANDKLDEQLEKYEYLYDLAERNLETSKLLQGEEDYETQLKYYNQMKAVNIERQRLLRDEILMWERKIEAEIEAGRENSEAVKTMQEHLTEAQEELANTTAESLELIAESYEIAKQKLTKDMDLAATGGKGLNYLAQEWELLNDNADMYLDAVNSAYEISQLESKVLDAIDNTDSVYAQEKLNKLMDAELGKLREKEKITKYDIERANKLLDIELQRIALEEAQASKTQMRLRRDSQGNYTYQYVSDQDKVREAQEALEQAQNELYNMDKDAYKNNLDEIQSAYQDYIDEVNDLNILYADNEEEFYNQLILLNEKYNERIDGLTDQNKTIGFNLQGSTLDMVAKITGMDADALQMLSTKEIDKIMAQYIPQWSSGVAEMVAKLANGGFNELSEQLVEQLLKLEDSQKAEMDAAALQGNESLNNIANGADVVKDKINELGAETRDTFNEMDAMLKSLSESALKTEEIANNLKEAAEASAQIANNGNPLIYEKASGVDISDGKLDFSNSDSEIEGMNFKQYDNIQSTNSSANKEWYGNKNSILNGLENRIEKVPSDSLDAKKSILNGVEYSQFLIDKLNTSIEDKINQLEKYISNRQNKNPFVTEDLSKELNQSITINADFPDATNAKEIEDAFNNLINAASQYAYKVKK